MIGSARTRRKWRLPALAGIVTVAVIAAWRVFRLSEVAHIGAGYAAEQTCACLFVSSRSLESCRGDLNPLTRWVVSVRPGTDQVTASSLGLAKATAQYEKNFGCTLQD
jgi:hypothetical protein